MRLAAISLALLLLFSPTACRSLEPATRRKTLPDPLGPPVPGAELTTRQQRAVRDAVSSAARADWTRFGRSKARIPPGHPVAEFLRLLGGHLRGDPVGAAAAAFAQRYKEYPAAVELAVAAARKEGNLRGALALAREQTVSDPGWQVRVDRLLNELTAEEMAAARLLMAQGKAEEALKTLRELLKLHPGREDVRRLGVRAALAASDLRGAAMLVAGLGDNPENMDLKAAVAEGLGQWELALSFSRQLPAETPDRCRRILHAWDEWRLADAPQVLRDARQAAPLLRRHLASILAWEVPELQNLATGSVPVLEDAVQLPEVADVVVAVRSGVMDADVGVRRFYPDRIVEPEELEDVLNRLAATLGKGQPDWCREGGQKSCLGISEPVDGVVVVELVRRVVGLEETLCR